MGGEADDLRCRYGCASGVPSPRYQPFDVRLDGSDVRRGRVRTVPSRSDHDEPAIRLYEKFGFQRTRELLLLEADSLNGGRENSLPPEIEIREIHRHENIPFESFWDGKPSWQNSVEAVERSIQMKRVFGAFIGQDCVGYIVFSAGMGRLAQLAVHRDHRRKGIGTRLLIEMQKDSTENNLQVINLDESMTESVVFFQNRGFKKVLGQYEMLMEM